jgi:DNA-binding Lrp family transcriptional regulator
MELDRFDRQLLKLVQEDAGQTAERLADQVQLSPSAIQRRLRRMREEGVIVRECAVVDPNALGRPTFFIVSLQVESERPELLAQLRNWLAAEKHVQQVFYVTGEADFVLIVTAADTEAFETLMSRMLGDNPNVKRFTTNVAMSVLKRGLAIPVPAETGIDRVTYSFKPVSADWLRQWPKA